MNSPRRRSKRLTRRFIGVALVLVAMGIVFATFRSWQHNSVRPDSVVVKDTRTDYEIAVQDGDAKDAQKQIEILRDQTNIPIPIHVENLDKRLKLADRMIRLADSPKLRKFAVRSRINALIDREIVSIKYGIRDSNVSKLLREEKQSSAVTENDLMSLALVGESYSKVGVFVAEENLQLRQTLRNESWNSFNATLEACEIDDDELALRLSELIDLVNGHATTAEGLPYAESFINKFDATKNIFIRSAINDKKFGLERTSLVLPEFISSLADQRETIIQRILITLNDAAAQGNVDRVTAETGIQRVHEMIRLGYYSQARQLSERLRDMEDLVENGAERLNRCDAIVERYQKRPFQFNGIVDSAGRQIQFEGANPKNRLLLFVSAASQRQSQDLFGQLVRSIGPKSESKTTRLSLVYVDQGDAPGALQKMRKFARSVQSATVWFVRLRRPGAVDVPQEHFIAKFPFLMVLDSENRIVAADPPFGNILEYLH